MHQAQASSTTSLPSDNCSSLDIKPSIQQNGTSQQSAAPKQREGTVNSGNTNNNNNNSNSSNNNNTTSNVNANSGQQTGAQNSSLNGGLFDNSQNVYGSSGNAYDNTYSNYHQANNVAAAATFHGANATSNGASIGGQLGNMRVNLSPPLHSHHHHHSSSLSTTSPAANKPQRTKPRTSAGKRTQLPLSSTQHTLSWDKEQLNKPTRITPANGNSSSFPLLRMRFFARFLTCSEHLSQFSFDSWIFLIFFLYLHLNSSLIYFFAIFDFCWSFLFITCSLLFDLEAIWKAYRSTIPRIFLCPLCYIVR